MYKRGEIILVNLNPIRPCVVVSDTNVNEILDLVTVVPCSTNLLGEGLFRINLSPRDRLEKQCEVMVEQIRGISKKRILESLSEVNIQEMKKIESGVKALLGL